MQKYDLQRAILALDIPGPLKFLLLTLTIWIGSGGPSVWPSNTTLARALGCQPRSVQTRLHSLEKLGLVTLAYQGQKRVVTLNITPTSSHAPEQTTRVQQDMGGCTPVHGGVHSSAWGGCPDVHPNKQEEEVIEPATEAARESAPVQEQEQRQGQTIAQELWSRHWGPSPCPGALLGLDHRTASCAIAGLLHKRNSPGGIKNLTAVVGYVLQDLEQGRRSLWSGWTDELLGLVAAGQSPQEVQERAQAQAQKEGQRSSRPELREFELPRADTLTPEQRRQNAEFFARLRRDLGCEGVESKRSAGRWPQNEWEELLLLPSASAGGVGGEEV